MRVTAPAPSSIPSNWTRASIVRLLHSIILSHLTPKYIYTLLPSHTHLDINTLLKTLTTLSNNRLTDIPSICAGVDLYPRRRRAILKKSKSLTKFPKTRVSVLVTPADNTSLAAVSEAGHHPFVEVVLKQNRPCWHVVTHLYSKWSLPFQLVDNNNQAFEVSTSVGCLPTQTNSTSSSQKQQQQKSQHSHPVVTVHYRIVKPDIQWSVIAAALRPQPPTLPHCSPNLNLESFSPQSPTQTTSTPYATSSSNADPPVIRRLRARIQQPDDHPQQADSNQLPLSTDDVASEQDSTPPKSRPPQPIIHTVCPDQFLATASLFDMPVNVALPDSLLSTSGDREAIVQHANIQPNTTTGGPNQCVPPEAPSLPPDFLHPQQAEDVEVDAISFENHIQENVQSNDQPNDRQLLQEEHEQQEYETEQNGVLGDTHQIQMHSEDACTPVEHEQVQTIFDHDEHNLFHTFSLGLHSRSVFGTDHGFSQHEQLQSNLKEVAPVQNSLGFSGLFATFDQ